MDGISKIIIWRIGMAKKKILMIIPTLSNGGAERVVSNLTIGLEKEYDIDILLDYDNVGYDYRGNIIKCLPNVKKEPKGFLKIFMNLKKYTMLRRMKKNHQYDVYISHLRLSNLLNALSGSSKCKTIATVHYSITRKMATEKGFKSWFYIERFSYKNVTKVVAVSLGVAKEVQSIYGISKSKLCAIWNGSDIARTKQLSNKPLNAEQKKWFEDGKRNIVAVGRYNTLKAQWHLIRAVSEVVKYNPDIKLLLLGDGELRAYYEQLIDELGIGENVILTGFQNNPFAIISKSSIFVLCSLSEGMPCTLVEAICCGIPCVITDFPSSSREILKIETNVEIPQDGYLVGDYGVVTPLCSGKKYRGNEPLETGEIALANAIKELLENDELREKIVINNKRRIQEFDISEMIKKWKDVIEEV